MASAVDHATEDHREAETPHQLPAVAIEKIGRIVDAHRASVAALNPDAPQSQPIDLLKLALSIYQFNRVRGAEFGTRLFSDPKWEMLLHLFIAGEQSRKVGTTEVCGAASSPATTSLRHLSGLVKHGLVRRVESEQDARVAWISLSPAGYEKLVRVLRRWSLKG